jgi:hypothetical protein
LVALWLASYNWRVEVRGLLSSQAFEFASGNGRVTFQSWEELGRRPTGFFNSNSADSSFYWSLRKISPLGIFVRPRIRIFEAWCSHWILAILAAALAAAPWIKWSRRFSLRTFLIAITLVALALGLIIATTR